MGPQTIGDRPINAMYAALLKLITLPVVLYSLATSGVAARTLVLLTGLRNAQKDKTATMMTFLPLERRS